MVASSGGINVAMNGFFDCCMLRICSAVLWTCNDCRRHGGIAFQPFEQVDAIDEWNLLRRGCEPPLRNPTHG